MLSSHILFFLGSILLFAELKRFTVDQPCMLTATSTVFFYFVCRKMFCICHSSQLSSVPGPNGCIPAICLHYCHFGIKRKISERGVYISNIWMQYGWFFTLLYISSSVPYWATTWKFGRTRLRNRLALPFGKYPKLLSLLPVLIHCQSGTASLVGSLFSFFMTFEIQAWWFSLFSWHWCFICYYMLYIIFPHSSNLGKYFCVLRRTT